MSAVLFIVEIVVVFIATLAVLHYFGNLRKTHVLVTLAVFVSWFFSFLIVFILPMDVTNTCYINCLRKYENHSGIFLPNIPGNNTNNVSTTFAPTTTVHPSTTPAQHKCVKPWSHMPGHVLPDMWKTIYWSSMILSWLLLPVMQSYVCAGDFTILGKLKTALYENSLWYASYLIIFGGLLIYVAADPDLDVSTETLRVICITASNTWGLLLLVLLMGYGLVDIPRKLWHMSIPTLRLDRTYFNVAKLSVEKEDAQEDLAAVLSEIKKSSDQIHYTHPLRKNMDVVISKCPAGSDTLFNQESVGNARDSETREGTCLSVKELAKLHKDVIAMSHRAARTQYKANKALKLSFYLEDVLNAELNKERCFIPSFSEHNPKSKLSTKLTWYWEIIVKRWMLKFVAVIMLILSLSLVWSEVTFFSSKPTLSIFAVLIDLTKKGNLFFSMEVISCLTIAYMCVCTYYTVFKMKFFNYYYFASNHQTDSNSLLFSGYLFCRLTYALCLNFLAMIHMDGHITGQTDKQRLLETDFTRFMGHLDLLAFVSKGVNVYYPMIVLLVCFGTYFTLGKRLLHCCGVDQFIIADDFSSDLVREGKEIVKREKRKLQRQINGTGWSDKASVMRDKYTRFGRNKDVEKIDDSNTSGGDFDALDSPKVNVKTKLGTEGVKKYMSAGADDKLDLINNVEDIAEEPTSHSRSTVPRNIFDDA